MPFITRNLLKYFTFDSFSEFGIPHGFFTRIGGCSPKPWESLNLATSVGDSRNNVLENRRRILSALPRPQDSIFDVWQIHGNTVVIADKPRENGSTHQKADGIITSSPEITLLMLFADCVPIFVFDPRNNVVAIAHAGWKGTVNRIGANLINKLKNNFGTKPNEIIAGIGPSIGFDHYEIRQDVYEEAHVKLDQIAKSSIRYSGNQIHFDLKRANKEILKEQGVLRIEIADICTACNPLTWFSHRAENGKTGRFAGVLALPKPL